MENKDNMEWAASPLTTKLNRGLQAAKKAAYADWKARSERTADAGVARAYAQYQSALHALELLKGAVASGEVTEEESE